MKTANLAMMLCISVAALLAACKPAEAPVASDPIVTPQEAPASAPVATVDVPAADTTSAADTPVIGADYPLARDACLAEVAKKTGVAQEKLIATEVLWAQAGVGVTVKVPDADAPWSCLSDEKGKVQGAAYAGSEGKL